MRESELWRIALPKGDKVVSGADDASPVHLGGLSIKFWQLDLRGSGRVRRGDLPIKVELHRDSFSLLRSFLKL